MAGFPTVTCAGVITVDVIAVTSCFPKREGRMEAEDVVVTGGGPAANAATTLARQGVPSAVIGRVGADSAGEQAISLLANEGVDVSGIEVDPSVRTQTSCIIVDRSSGTRSIVTTKNPPLSKLTPRAHELIEASQWLHLDHLGYDAGTKSCSKMNNPPLVSLDSGNAPIANLDLSRVDLYAPTLDTLISGAAVRDPSQAAHSALENGCHAVVATDGSNGSLAWWDEVGAHWAHETSPGSFHASGYNAVTPVSTLGAGDVFHGALLSMLIQGFPWPAALTRANAVAALSCEGKDGRETVPTRERLDHTLARTGKR